MKYILPSIVLGLTPVSLNAQEGPEPDPVALVTPEQDLDCAIYITLVGSKTRDKGRDAIVGSMGYFIGRYEAVTGQDVGVAAYARLESATIEDILAQDEDCLARVVAMMESIESLGDAFKSLNEELSATEQPSN